MNDLSGRRFGRLVAVKGESREERGRKTVWWLCRCDCGKDHSVRAAVLVAGKTRGCGCRSSTPRSEDLTGQRFGRLLVLSRERRKTSDGRGRWTWCCRCSCGKETSVYAKHLKNGATKSCGCLVREPKKDQTEVGRRRIFNNYKSTAAHKDLSFEFSESTFLALASLPCHYCGIEAGPSTFNVNGVDRVDSSDWYRMSNCVACCSECNMAKRSMPVERFLALASRIVKHQNTKGGVS